MDEQTTGSIDVVEKEVENVVENEVVETNEDLSENTDAAESDLAVVDEPTANSEPVAEGETVANSEIAAEPQPLSPKERLKQQRLIRIRARALKKKEKRIKKKEERMARKERIKRRKAEKKQEWKDHHLLYRMFIRGMQLCGIGLFLLIFALVVFELFAADIFYDYYIEHREDPVEAEEIYALSPLDEEGAKRVAEIPAYGEDDTWAIYIYMIGSNLESDGENDLSEVVNYITKQKTHENEQREAQEIQGFIRKFVDDLEKENMELPGPMYYEDIPAESYSETVTNDVVKANKEGCASADIREILGANLNKNIDICIQTGGASRWSNPLINPNRTQRFTVKEGVLIEEESLPIADMCSEKTLWEFLCYCKDNHDADHRILIMWDHGSGSFGYGNDENYGSSLNNIDIDAALFESFGYNVNNPPFEIIGYDACLMANADVLANLHGYGRYFVGSEELEPGFGWDYSFLNALSENTAVSGAYVGQLIADSYMDNYMTENVHFSDILGDTAVQFSVIDINKADECYNKYLALLDKVLSDSVSDNHIITRFSRAASGSIRFGQYVHDIYNHVDLGLFMENFNEYYPKETKAVQDSIEDAVVYHRENSYITGAKGLSVYYPMSVSGINGLYHFLKYIEHLSSSDSMRILYYYKIAGCLNDDLKARMISNGMEPLKNINTGILYDVSKIEPQIQENSNFVINISKEASDLIQDYQYCLIKKSDYDNALVYYGMDNKVSQDENGSLRTDFDGKWICIDGCPLATEIISETSSNINYKSAITLDGNDAYLMIVYNKEKDEYKIAGAYIKEYENGGYGASRTKNALEIGCSITPVYDAVDIDSAQKQTTTGKTIEYTNLTKVEYQEIDNGEYYGTIYFTDTRGDEFNSAIVAFNIESGKAVNAKEEKGIRLIFK